MWRQGLWAPFDNLLLGVWLVTSPFTLGYSGSALARSDIATGGAVVLLALLSYSRRFGAWAQWANCFAGIRLRAGAHRRPARLVA